MKNSSLAFKIWYIINIFLTALCIIALYYGFDRAAIEHGNFIDTLRYTALTFYLPSMFIAALLSGSVLNEQFYTQMRLSSIILIVLLVINFILALIFYRQHRQDSNPHWRTNFILAIPPFALALITILVRFL